MEEIKPTKAELYSSQPAQQKRKLITLPSSSPREYFKRDNAYRPEASGPLALSEAYRVLRTFRICIARIWTCVLSALGFLGLF